MDNHTLRQVKGQVVVEYVLLFAVGLTLMLVASNFMSAVRERMNETRDVGVELIMRR